MSRGGIRLSIVLALLAATAAVWLYSRAEPRDPEFGPTPPAPLADEDDRPPRAAPPRRDPPRERPSEPPPAPTVPPPLEVEVEPGLDTTRGPPEGPAIARVTVVGADGRTPDDVTVEVVDWHDAVDPPPLDADAEPPRLPRDVDGRGFTVHAEPDTDRPVITVRATGYAPFTWRANAHAADTLEQLEIELSPAGSIAGRVLTAGGAPVDHALVVAVEAGAIDHHHPDALAAARDLVFGSGRYDDDIAYRFATARSFEGGRFLLDELVWRTPYFVFAVSEAHGDSAAPPRIEAALVPESVDLRLRPLVTVAVTVRAAGGAPIEAASAELRASPRPTEWRETAPGLYLLMNVSVGSHVLDIETETHGELRHDFTVPEGATSYATEVIVPVGGTVTGIVFDDAGAVLVDARVNLQYVDRPALELRSVSTRTDADGRFSMSGLPDAPITLYASRGGFVTAALRDLPSPVPALEIRLRRARDFGAAIVTPPGVALPHRLEMATRLAGTDDEWLAGKAYARDGRLDIVGAHAGRCMLRLWTPGCALYERGIDVPATGPVDIGEVRLAPARTVTVRIVNAVGEPVAGAKVHAMFESTPPIRWKRIEKTSDSRGLAVLELHADGPITVYIEQAPGWRRVHRPIGELGDRREPVDVPIAPR
jgi:hypothetical protein